MFFQRNIFWLCEAEFSALKITRIYSQVGLPSGSAVKNTPVGLPSGSAVKNTPANARDASSIPESGRSPGEGNSNPLQYSCLENPTDRGTWQATVHSVAKNQTWRSIATQQFSNKRQFQELLFKNRLRNDLNIISLVSTCVCSCLFRLHLTGG